ncbi:MAG: segregation/condensation protein A [Clostridiaceae bacterium]|nr:segregation/condensation protein A [Clostridiaceae bacterium]
MASRQADYMMTGIEDSLAVDIFEYEGPLDLLNQLVERNRVPINRLSIAAIADQYLQVIRSNPVFDMELASSFLLMAASLIHLKSTLLLPQGQTVQSDEAIDPGDLLVLRLLEYRRCRLLAAQLRQGHQRHSGSYTKAPAAAESLGICRQRTATQMENSRFDLAVQTVEARNKDRFQDTGQDVEQILERERISLAERMLTILRHITGRSRIFFYEIFPPELPALERITGFLAMLELVFQNKAKVTQKALFSPIMIERKGR